MSEGTLFVDKWGSLRNWVVIVGMIFLVFGVAGIIVGVAITDKYEVEAFNRIHETDYSWGEWFWAESTIKDYHLGDVKNINLDVKGIEGLCK